VDPERGVEPRISDAVYQRATQCLVADPTRYDFRYIVLGVFPKRL